MCTSPGQRNIMGMFQGIRELTAAKGRTGLIIVTVALITVMVTFLSSLSSGLSFQSVSALQHRLTGDQALVLEDNGSTSLSSSRLSPEQIEQVESKGGEVVFMARAKAGSTPVVLLSDASLPEHTAIAPSELSADSLGASLPDAHIQTSSEEFFLDHLPVVSASPSLVAAVPGAASAAIVSSSSSDAIPPHTQVLSGKDRWNASASYAGEQMSLNLMINLLYVISALVLGAFFTVWTLQRLRGVAISTALGASRRVLISDSVGQAFLVLGIGILAGTAITLGTGQLLPDSVPAVLSTHTILIPSLILAASGLLGAAISLKPVLSVEPRSALANA